MSVGFALRATDGVVVVADGRTTSVESGASAGQDTVKMCAAPGDLPFVVVVIGRATVNGRHASAIVADVLGSVPQEELANASLRQVTSLVLAGLAGAASAVPMIGADESDGELIIGFHVLVAGFSGQSPGSGGRASVWTGSIPSTGPWIVESFADVTMCGPGTTDVDLRVSELFDGFNDALHSDDLNGLANPYRLKGLRMADVRSRAIEMLRTSVEDDSSVFDDGGVGGEWRFARVGPTGRVEIDSSMVGP